MAATAPPLSASEAVIASGLDSAFLPLMLAHRARDLRDGIPFELISGRRGWDHQSQLYAAYIERRRVWEAAGKVGPEPRPAAAPGKSKHELGFAYDRRGPRTSAEWERSAENAEALGLEAGIRYGDREHFEAPESMARIRSAIWLRVAALAAAIAVAVAAAEA